MDDLSYILEPLNSKDSLARNGVEKEKDDTITDAGTTIKTVYGYPEGTADGIIESVELSGFSSSASSTLPKSIKFWNGSASKSPATCVTYTEATSKARYTVVNELCG